MAAKPKPSERERNLEAYNRRRAELEAEHRGEYVAVASGRIVGVYPTFDEACAAVEQHETKLVFEIGDRPDLGPLRISSIGRKLGRIVR